MDSDPRKPSSIRPFPWSALPAVPREASGAWRDARRAVAGAIDTGAIGGALSEILGERARVQVTRVEVAVDDTARLGSVSIALGTVDDAVRVELELDVELARAIVGHAIGRPVKIGQPQTPLGPEVEGALMAVVLQVARRAHGAGAPFVPVGRGAWRRALGERRLCVHAAVHLDRDAYAARATVELRSTLWGPSADPAARLFSLGGLSISLPLVAAVSLGRASELFALAPGDIWLPGGGWTARRDPASARLVGEGVLAAPASTRGIGVKLGPDGEIVLVGEKAISLDVETAMPSPNEDQTATSEIVLDAPMIVRVEVGAVTLTAAEWSALGPGDVIALGRRVNEPVVLRIAGTQVARGELVDIEGEIGVRIRERGGST
jgi:flagellar motor switch/type III secretory pathway protein FliN